MTTHPKRRKSRTTFVPYSKKSVSAMRMKNPRTTTHRRKKRRTLRKSRPSMPPIEVIGRGKDGYVLSLPPPSNMAMKVHTKGIYPAELMQHLKEIENAEKYFTIEERMENAPPISQHFLRKNRLDTPMYVTRMIKLEPIPDTKKLTRAQYRHLRDGLQLLHKSGIAHRDIVDNVMLHPDDHQPRIIDWNNAILHPTDIDKTIDMNAFFQFYKVGGGR